MNDSSTSKYEVAASLCRIAREKYQAYCVRTQRASYDDTPLSDLEKAIARQYGPTGDWSPGLAKRLTFHAHLYISMAEQHLSGLETLLAHGACGLPLGPAARSVEEASGRALWLLDSRLGLARSDARRRVARLLLDEEDGARIHKRLAYDFSHPDRAESGENFRRARDAVRKPGLFYESEIKIVSDGGVVELRGETLPSPSRFVHLAGELFGDDPSETRGYYGYMSAMTHPTVFAFLETLVDVSELPQGYGVIPWKQDGDFALKVASNAVRGFHNAWRAWIGWTNTGMDEALAVHTAHQYANRSDA